MWQLLPRRLQVLLIAGVAIGGAYSIDFFTTIATGHDAGVWKAFSLTVTLITGALVAFAQLFWFKIVNAIPWLQTKTFPDLNGTWEGTLHSTYKVPETGEPWPPIPTTVTIRQNLLSAHVSLKTGESGSESTRTFLEPFYDTKKFRIWYSYNNDPKAQVRHRSTAHEGVAFLELDWDADRSRLTGRYYNDRASSGDMDLRRQQITG